MVGEKPLRERIVVPEETWATAPAELFLLEWERDDRKEQLSRVNDALQRTLTLATALAGGSVYFYRDEVAHEGFRFAAILLFLAAAATAYRGLCLIRRRMRDGQPLAFRAAVEAAVANRSWWLDRATWLVFGGLFVAALGVLFRVVRLG